MDKESIHFIRSILPEGRTVFYDFPDRYAFLLLEMCVPKSGCKVRDLKEGPLRPLLAKPSIKQFLSHFGDAQITPDDLQASWPVVPQAYRLSLGTWPPLSCKPSKRWAQITRLGYNIVLQLNCSVSHRRELGSLVPAWEEHLFAMHPIAFNGELTLAWARIDFDLETGEALIEEIQSDWVKDVKRYAAHPHWYSETGDWASYYHEVLLPLASKWQETMLTAAIWFLAKEIGIRTIFYHTYETGRLLKKISGTPPPRSLYTDLPRKFCFKLTHNGPLFVRDCEDRDMHKLFTDPNTQWQVLHLDESLMG